MKVHTHTALLLVVMATTCLAVYSERRHSFTLTFKRGGATDFTRLLFRLTEGLPLY